MQLGVRGCVDQTVWKQGQNTAMLEEVSSVEPCVSRKYIQKGRAPHLKGNPTQIDNYSERKQKIKEESNESFN